MAEPEIRNGRSSQPINDAMPADSAINTQLPKRSLIDRVKEYLGFGDISGEIRDTADIVIHDWDGPDDPDNPFNWSTKYKWLLTLTVCFISILTGLPAGTYGSGNNWMEKEWNVQNSPFPNLYWATTSWNMGAAFWPLIFVPLTESSGRMPGYFVSYSILVATLFGSAFAQNFATIVVTRFFGGGASSVSINIVGGSISDVWKGGKARSLPMSLFGFTSVIGIALGPFIGSAIVQIPILPGG